MSMCKTEGNIPAIKKTIG